MTKKEIKEIRIKLHLTQTEFAKMLGVSFVTVNRWENGWYKPSKLAEQEIKRKIENGSLSS
jgi:putative transcriptional regulator